jgi:hypothetical protein
MSRAYLLLDLLMTIVRCQEHTSSLFPTLCMHSMDEKPSCSHFSSTDTRHADDAFQCSSCRLQNKYLDLFRVIAFNCISGAPHSTELRLFSQ